LKSIDSSLNKKDGKSNIFDIQILNNFQVNQENVWLLFLPNFKMETPFHYLLDNNELFIFHQISNGISDGMFEQFLSNSEYFEKIKNMFIFILENKYCYPLDSIKNNYSSLYFKNDDDDDDDDYDDTEDEKIKKINKYLDKINEKLCESFQQRNDFIIDFTTQFQVSKNLLK